jgi:uncharacterized protein
MARDEAIALLKAQESELRARGLTHVALFGSMARNEAGPDSDIDLLVDFDRNSKFSLLDLIDIQYFLEDRFGRKVDFAFERKMRPRMKARVLGESIAVF